MCACVCACVFLPATALAVASSPRLLAILLCNSTFGQRRSKRKERVGKRQKTRLFVPTRLLRSALPCLSFLSPPVARTNHCSPKTSAAHRPLCTAACDQPSVLVAAGRLRRRLYARARVPVPCAHTLSDVRPQAPTQLLLHLVTDRPTTHHTNPSPWVLSLFHLSAWQTGNTSS